MNYYTTLLITLVVLGFTASSFARKYVERTDRLCSFWRFLMVALIANLVVSALGYLFEPEQWVRWQIWINLVGGVFLLIAVLRLAQSLLDFDFLQLPVESEDPATVGSRQDDSPSRTGDSTTTT